MMLESCLHGDNAFATLTYDDEHLPRDLSVRPAVLSGFNKRLRKAGFKFRYFGCGEYGDYTFRPHYHLALFGFKSCYRGVTRKGSECCSICTAVANAWGNGQIMLGELNSRSMAYVAGYISKKMTREHDPRLEGRRPEFARMSNRPGIGKDFMHEVASALLEHGFNDVDLDVPICLRHGSTEFPLGRYLRQQLRMMVGRDKKCPEKAIAAYGEKMQPLRDLAFNNSVSLQKVVLASTEGRRIQVEARYARSKKVDGL